MGVAAVVVNYNAGRHLLDCAASLVADGVDEVVVVDNASSDGSLEALEGAALPGVRCIRTGTNRGYGAAANVGVRVTGADLVLVCNPDLVVGPGALKAMVDRMASDPVLGVLGPALRNTDGSTYVTGRPFPSLKDALGHAFAGMVWPSNPWTRRYFRSGWDRRDAAYVDWVSGACMLVRRRAFDLIGGFDERFFMFMEDVDLCWRAASAGWRVGFEPGAEVLHHVGASRARHPYRMIVAHHRSLWRWSNVRWSGWHRAALPLALVAIATRGAVVLAAQAVGHRPPPPSADQPA